MKKVLLFNLIAQGLFLIVGAVIILFGLAEHQNTDPMVLVALGWLCLAASYLIAKDRP